MAGRLARANPPAIACDVIRRCGPKSYIRGGLSASGARTTALPATPHRTPAGIITAAPGIIGPAMRLSALAALAALGFTIAKGTLGCIAALCLITLAARPILTVLMVAGLIAALALRAPIITAAILPAIGRRYPYI